MDLTQPRKKKVLSAAAGLKPAELVLKNASFVNVFTSEVQVADIAICCGIIAGIGSYHGQSGTAVLCSDGARYDHTDHRSA